MQLRIEAWRAGFATLFADAPECSFRLAGFADGVPAGIIGGDAVDDAVVVRYHLVEEGFRGLGLGGMLLEELVTLAESSGFRRVEASVPPGDRIAKLTYESSSFKAVRIVLCRELLPG